MSFAYLLLVFSASFQASICMGNCTLLKFDGGCDGGKGMEYRLKIEKERIQVPNTIAIESVESNYYSIC